MAFAVDLKIEKINKCLDINKKKFWCHIDRILLNDKFLGVIFPKTTDTISFKNPLIPKQWFLYIILFFSKNLPFGIAVKWLHTSKLIIITMNTLLPYHFTKTEFRNFTNFLTNQKQTRHALIGGKIHQNSEFGCGNSWNHVVNSV